MNLWRPDGNPSHVLKFELDEHSNTPTAVNVSCTTEEREMIGPYLWTSCTRHSLAFNTHDQAPKLSVNTILTRMHLSVHRWQIHQMSI
jgi:hypothetical protein